MTRSRRPVVLLAALLGVACSDPLANDQEAAIAREHLEIILDVMEQNSVNRRTIDWTAFRASVNAAAPNPGNIGGTFPAIHLALGLLGDNHGIYIGPPEWSQTVTNSTVACPVHFAADLDIPTDIGYVKAGPIAGSGAAAAQYASRLQVRISQEDFADPVGWIVDLRGNSGGNLWPMIAGLGPILGERALGYFIEPDGVERTLEYQDGEARLDGVTRQDVLSPYYLKTPEPRVAVLIDEAVASWGEGAAIAFKGRPNTRFFGVPTCGLTTALSPFLIHGAVLQLSVAKMADRNRTVYDRLIPDEEIVSVGPLRDRVITWVRGG